MTLDMLFVLVVPTYLVLVAYGQVGARRRGLSPRGRTLAGTVRVAVPPLALYLALLSTRDAGLVVGCSPVIAGMLAAGAITAVLVELVAPRVGG